MSLTHEDKLTPELLEIERQLSALEPCALSEDLVARVEKSVHISTGAEDAELAELEQHLGHITPAAMPSDMISRMARAMDRWHEYVPVEEKIVEFGEQALEGAVDSGTDSGAGKITPGHSRRGHSAGMLAAVAAVALFGAVSALVMPHFHHPTSPGNGVVASVDSKSSDDDVRVTSKVQPRDAWLVPDSLSHKVTSTSDRGVVMTRDNTPHRCIRVEYTARMIVLDEDGREIEIKRPSIDYMLLPVETH